VTEKLTLSDLKRQERDARRQLILDAAMELFSSRSISNVGIRDIAKKAGISPALIYRHFEDRDELFVEAFFKKNEEIITIFERMIEEKEDVTTEKIGESFVRFLMDNDDFFQMMTHFMLDSVMRDDAIEQFNHNMRRLLAGFDSAFESSGISEEVRLHSHAFFASLNGVMITFRSYPGRSEEEIRKHILHLTRFISLKFMK
jgi:AcrR family transcriptional regulator